MYIIILKNYEYVFVICILHHPSDIELAQVIESFPHGYE